METKLMDKKLKRIQALDGLSVAFRKLDEVWDEVDNDLIMPCVGEYPFATDFSQKTRDVCDWVEVCKEKILENGEINYDASVIAVSEEGISGIKEAVKNLKAVLEAIKAILNPGNLAVILPISQGG